MSEQAVAVGESSESLKGAPRRFEAVVMGAGPAGLALAAELAAAGVHTACVAPSPRTRWVNNYGIWLDEAQECGVADCLEATYDDPLVMLGDEPIHLARTYGRVDNAALQGHFSRRFEGAGGEFVRGVVAAVEPGVSAHTVRLRDGGALLGRLVVDATGAGSAFVRREPRRMGKAVAGQAAFGLTLRGEYAALKKGQMVLMDWRPLPCDACGYDGPPTFLYAIPLGDGRLFVEETSLVARPMVDLAVCEQRLHERMATCGIRFDEVIETERCMIPMGEPLPVAGQAVASYGAAASMVHPATGFLVNRALRFSPLVAAVGAEALRRGASAQGASDAVMGAVWPEPRRRQQMLFAFGMETLLTLDAVGLRKFFAAFFALPRSNWEGYFAGRDDAGGLATTMLSMFVGAPMPLKAALARSALGSNFGVLMRALRV